MRNKGFSLIELLVIVAILGVLAAIAAVSYRGYINNAKAAVVTDFVIEIEQAYISCYADREHGSYYWDHDNNSTTDAEKVAPTDCLDINVLGLSAPNQLVVTDSQNSMGTIGCFEIEHNDFAADKELKQCIDFDVGNSGNKTKHYKDDGTKDGACSSVGVCG